MIIMGKNWKEFIMKYLFISYVCGQGIGNIYISSELELFSDKILSRKIEENCGYRTGDVVILYYKQITKEEFEFNVD